MVVVFRQCYFSGLHSLVPFDSLLQLFYSSHPPFQTKRKINCIYKTAVIFCLYQIIQILESDYPLLLSIDIRDDDQHNISLLPLKG